MSLLKRRFFSFYIDLLSIISIVGIIYISINSFASTYLMPYLSSQGANIFTQNLDSILNPIYIMTIFNYFFLSIYLSNGNTIGTTIMNLKIVSNNQEKPLDFNQSFSRASVYCLSILIGYLPFIINLFKKNNLGFADQFSSSKAVLLDSSEQTIYLDHQINSPQPMLIPISYSQDIIDNKENKVA